MLRSSVWRRGGQIVQSLFSKRKLILPALFVLLSLPVCLFLSVSVPTGEPPDEPSHILRAASLLHGDILGLRQKWSDADGNVISGAGVTANPALLAASLDYLSTGSGIPEKKMSTSLLEKLHNLKWAASSRFVYAPNTAVYMPLFYVPGAAALGLAHEIHIGPYAAILLGRLANALCFMILGLAAILLARRGRFILFVVLTLPMTLSLAASFNQDGLLIAASALSAALLTRCTGPCGKSYWLSGIILAFIIAAKIAYLPLAGVMLIPALFDIERASRRALLKSLTLTTVPGVIWTVISALFVASPFVRGPAYRPGPLWPGDPNRIFHTTDVRSQLEVFLHRPLLALSLPMHDLRSHVVWHRLREMVGVLGQLDVMLPSQLYLLWYMAVACALIADVAGIKNKPRLSQAGSVFVGSAVVVLSWIAVYDTQYLSWTLVGAADVDGVQGRYWLPLLAFTAPALPSFRVVSRPASLDLIRGVFILPAISAATVGLVVLPQIVVLKYYLQ